MSPVASPPRAFSAPEVVQTSSMDCGPASLAALLGGFGIPASYGRLREACQTDVDGTSIDALEETAVLLGLEAEQVMIPADHLLLDEARALPAIVVVRLPNGFTHFVVVWRRLGPFVQVMDPASGRRWIHSDRLMDEVYLHTFDVPAADWREWAGSDEFLEPLRRRLRDLGGDAEGLVAEATADAGWRGIAALDAATRATTAVRRGGGLRRPEVRAVLAAAFQRARDRNGDEVVPGEHWSVRPHADDPSMLRLRGIVLVRVRGRSKSYEPDAVRARSAELAAALDERPRGALRQLAALLREDAGWPLLLLLPALLVAGAAVALEALLFRGVLDLAGDLALVPQRLWAVGALAAFGLALLLLEMGAAGTALRLGRLLEVRFRLAFQEKIPRLQDRYFHSRPISDMAERSHAIPLVRTIPPVAWDLSVAAAQLVLTVVALALLYPGSAALAVAGGLVALAIPLLGNLLLFDVDLRARTHGGALTRFMLDALLGIETVRAHGAEPAVRREHESLLVEWVRAGRSLVRRAVTLDAVRLTLGFGVAICLVADHVGRAGSAGGALLLAYWALSLPLLGESVAFLARRYPGQRSVALRVLEPLGAPEADTEEEHPSDGARARTASGLAPRKNGVALRYDGVTVHVAGRDVLREVEMEVPAGSQVAVVGASGAGKSTLVGLLLGWHRPTVGRVLADGAPLGVAATERLRRRTAWLDPGVYLWNRSLLDNLLYGTGSFPGGELLASADLYPILDRLPEGLQSRLGENGRLLSGGEGQRIRFGRALAPTDPALVILDEPFRGLARDQRRELLGRARKSWSGTTILCITHDVDQTTDFDHVVVLGEGRVLEQGAPGRLAGDEGSAYHALLRSDREVRETIWGHPSWTRLHLEDGRLRTGKTGP